MNGGTKWGIHYNRQHQDSRDPEIFEAWQPPSIKVINPEEWDVRTIHERCPETYIIHRDHPLSEQKDDVWRNPTETGKRHAWEMASHAQRIGSRRDRTILLGINEFPTWMPGAPSVYVPYNIAFLDECWRQGVMGGAMNINSGHPLNLGPDLPPNWEPWEAVCDAIIRGRHVLMKHEYCDHRGPEYMWRWWMGAYEQCPWRVPIIIGECGMDEYTSNSHVAEDYRGWHKHWTPEQYIGYMSWYDRKTLTDPRIHSTLRFTYDFPIPWGSFDERIIREQLLRYVQSMGGGRCQHPWADLDAETPVTPPAPEYLPDIETSTDPAILAEKVRWWTEEATRALEADNAERAMSILHSIIKLDNGLLYKLENILKG